MEFAGCQGEKGSQLFDAAVGTDASQRPVGAYPFDRPQQCVASTARDSHPDDQMLGDQASQAARDGSLGLSAGLLQLSG